MVDLNVPIYKMLKGLARVELEFPDAKATFPLITICEVSNTADLVIEGVEFRSDITYQIDVWDNGKDRSLVEDIANQVSHVLTANHFYRTMSRNMKDPSGLHRKTMYFKTKAGK